MDYSLPGFSIHGIFQARILEWVAISFSRRSSQPRNWTQISHTVGFTALPSELPGRSIMNSQSLLKLMSIDLVMPSNYHILCHLLLPPPSIFPSIRVFSNESLLCIRWPKYWSFSFSISPSYEYSGLISFRMDWLDLLAVQGTLKSLLQHHNSKASILQRSAFFILQLSYWYMTTGKSMALTRWTFIGKVMSLAFNMLSRLLFQGQLLNLKLFSPILGVIFSSHLWYICTLDYYSFIEMNKIWSFVETWMDLESIIQSKVSQKEKNKQKKVILMHIYGI